MSAQHKEDFSEQTAVNTRKTYRTTLVLLVVVLVTVLVHVGFAIVYLVAGARIGKQISSTPSSASHTSGETVGATALPPSADLCQQINAIFSTNVSSGGTSMPISQILTQGLNIDAKRGLYFDSKFPNWVYTLYAPLCTGRQSPDINLDLARKACAVILASTKTSSAPTLVSLNQAATALSTFFNNGNACSNIGIGDNNYPSVTTNGAKFPTSALSALNTIWFQAAVGSQSGQKCAISS